MDVASGRGRQVTQNFYTVTLRRISEVAKSPLDTAVTALLVDFASLIYQTTHGTKVSRQPPIIVPFAAQAAPRAWRHGATAECQWPLRLIVRTPSQCLPVPVTM
jgi:hypothetical protein